MASLFSKPKMPTAPVMLVPPPDDTVAREVATREAAAREAERIKKKKGMASTIMTGPQGLTTAPTVLKETLGD